VAAWSWSWRPWNRRVLDPDELPFPQSNVFQLVSVYNGHLVGKGRAVVDSSFHHWVDGNLKGLASDNGQPLTKTQAYHRNICLWLAPLKKQRSMFLNVLHKALQDYELRGEFAGRNDLTLDVWGRTLINYLATDFGSTFTRVWWTALLSHEQLIEFIRPQGLEGLGMFRGKLDEIMMGAIAHEMYVNEPSVSELERVGIAGVQLGLGEIRAKLNALGTAFGETIRRAQNLSLILSRPPVPINANRPETRRRPT
jgi:hypothetical protein